MFALFVLATLRFHDAAAVASTDLGRSVWTETAATTDWIADELPAAAVVGILRANEIAITPSTAPEDEGAGTVAAEDNSGPRFAADLQLSLVQFLKSQTVREQARRRSSTPDRGPSNR